VAGVGEQRVEQRVGTLAVIGAGGFEEGDGFGEGAAMVGEDGFEEGLVLWDEGGRFDGLRMRGPFDKLRPFDGLRMRGPFDKLRANGGDCGWLRSCHPRHPFGLSLSKPASRRIGPFDKLRANGGW
jgi:hypothetical protein